MPRITFAAHDPGAARMICAAVDLVRDRGHDVGFAGAGPALDIWREQGETVIDLDPDDSRSIAEIAAETDLLVTGTGFGSYDRKLWKTFGEEGVKTLAVIDSWTNLRKRFADGPAGGTFIYPDRIAVIDRWSYDQLMADEGVPVPVYVVGHPHLQISTSTIRRRRGQRAENPEKTLVFFSEPIREDYPGDTRGFDQFVAIAGLLSHLSLNEPVNVLIKLHPRENMATWNDKLAGIAIPDRVRVSITGEPVEDLLVKADGVMGMTTMVLLEAALAAIPVLSYQPNRKTNVFPIIDQTATVVTDARALRGKLTKVFGDDGDTVFQTYNLAAEIENSDQRFVELLEKLIK